MPQNKRNRRNRAAVAALLILLAGTTLAACGGSSKSQSKTTSASSTRQGQFGARAAALRTCLQKYGVTLPKRKPGERGRGRGANPFGAGGANGPGGSGGGPQQLPNGVSRAKLQAAFQKCGGRFAGGPRGFASAAGRQRFAKFAACMRANGVNLPAPNTSGKGPIFNTKGIDTSDSKFKAADGKCAHELAPAGAPGAGSGAGSAPGPGGPPGT
ncbi:MAG TPA: hypothetical protein VGF47_05395, partial [Solirubrobacteraceae bacterium]